MALSISSRPRRVLTSSGSIADRHAGHLVDLLTFQPEGEQDVEIGVGVELIGQRRTSEQNGGILLTGLQQHGDQAGLRDLHEAELHRPSNRQLNAVVPHDLAALLG